MYRTMSDGRTKHTKYGTQLFAAVSDLTGAREIVRQSSKLGSCLCVQFIGHAKRFQRLLHQHSGLPKDPWKFGPSCIDVCTTREQLLQPWIANASGTAKEVLLNYTVSTNCAILRDLMFPVSARWHPREKWA